MEILKDQYLKESLSEFKDIYYWRGSRREACKDFREWCSEFGLGEFSQQQCEEAYNAL